MIINYIILHLQCMCIIHCIKLNWIAPMIMLSAHQFITFHLHVHCKLYIALKLNWIAQMIRLNAHQPPFKSNARIASVPSTHIVKLLQVQLIVQALHNNTIFQDLQKLVASVTLNWVMNISIRLFRQLLLRKLQQVEGADILCHKITRSKTK